MFINSFHTLLNYSKITWHYQGRIAFHVILLLSSRAARLINKTFQFKCPSDLIPHDLDL